MIKLGKLEFKELACYEIYNDFTFVWATKPRDSIDRTAQYARPHKIPGDYGGVLRAAGVFPEHHSRQKKQRKRHARDQHAQDE